MPNIKKLADWLIINLENIEHEGGVGTGLDFPPFDLMPYDYLEYAEEELDKEKTRNKINAISHLKRALECELDTFIHVLGIRIKKYKNEYWKNVPTKLEFLEKIGIISTKSLNKLNKLRNKIEHEYHLPEISEIEKYYDLTFAVISAVDGFMSSCANNETMEFSLDSDGESTKNNMFLVEYHCNPPSIKFQLPSFSDNEKENKIEHLIFTPELKKEFIFAFSIYFLLIKYNNLVGHEYVIKKIKLYLNMYNSTS